MIETDKALDIFPVLGNIIEKLDIKELGTDGKKAGTKIFKTVLTKVPAIKKELYEIVNIISGTGTEEIKKQSFGKTITAFKQVTDDPDLMDFIKQAFK